MALPSLLQLSVKQRLIMISVVTTLSLLTLLGLEYYATHKVKELDQNSRSIVQANANMLMLRRHEKDFMARKDLKFQDKFNTTLSDTQAELDQLKTTLTKNNIDSSYIDNLKTILGLYGEKFNQIITLEKKIGLDPKDGLYGTLRQAVHNVEDKLAGLDDMRLLSDMLQLRRNEKDFMLRRDMKYIDKFNSNLDKFLSHRDESGHSPEDLAMLSSLLGQYKQDFLNLVKLEQEVGLDHNDGLHGELRDTVHQTEEMLTQAEDAIVAAVNKDIAQTDLVTMIMSVVLTVLNMLLMVWVAASIIRPVEKLSNAMSHASRERDLTQRVDIKGDDEIANMSNVFNTMLGEFSKLMAQVMDSANQLSSSAEQLTTVTEKSSKDVMRQRAESDQVATAINEMSSTVQEVAQNANQAASASRTADEQANKGNQVVSSAITGINKLAEQVADTAAVIKDLESESHNISTVLNVIQDIAEQTNLLALNAAIEAARAGEQGRGFAVVADEVRTLAQRSHESTKEINDIITRLQEKSTHAVAAMESGLNQTEESVDQAKQAGEALNEITKAVAAISEMNMQIASAAEEQSAVAEEINRNVVNITQIADETAEGSEETTRTSRTLAKMAVELRGMINQFRVV